MLIRVHWPQCARMVREISRSNSVRSLKWNIWGAVKVKELKNIQFSSKLSINRALLSLLCSVGVFPPKFGLPHC